MQHGSAFGWLLVGAFCASVSCGGGSSNGKTPQGFGLTCASDKDCASYDMICGDADKCVECLADGDCKGKEVCAAGLCNAPQDCNDSRDCASDQVCNDATGVCVECVTNRDCKTGQACSGSVCVAQQTCEFTSDCDDGLLCDAKAGVCVTCRTDADCGSKSSCVHNDCVSDSASGGTSSGGTGSGTAGKSSAGESGSGAGGKTTAGSSAGGTEAGGTEAGGKGGSAGTSGGGTGGGANCGCVGLEVCTPDVRCVAPTLIDDLVDCDKNIIAIEGRKGDWAAAADTGINLTHGFAEPGSAWTDQSCAAWAIGGETTVNNPNATFAFIGFRLNVSGATGLAYDLSAYNGLKVTLESDNSVQVVLKTTGGGYFQVTLPPYGLAGSHIRSAAFASMAMMNNSAEISLDLSKVYEVQFSVTTPQQFGLAVHRVELY